MEDNKTPAMSVIIPKIITATLSEKKQEKKCLAYRWSKKLQNLFKI